MPTKRLSPFLFLFLFILACASPMTTLKKGNYKKAYKQAMNQLKREKSVKENKKVLQKSLDKIIAEEKRAKEKLMDTDDIEDLVEAHKINKELQKKIEKSFTYLDNGHFDKDYDELREEANWMSEEIANTYFGFGQANLEEAMESNTKKLARIAYSDFETAKKYGYADSSIDSLKQECIYYGRLIYTVEAGISFGISYDWEINRTFDDLEDYESTFRKIYFERSGVKNVDCHMDIEFNDIDFEYYEETDRDRYKQNVQTGTETVTDDDGNVSEVPVYSEVEGEVSLVTKTKVATWEVRVDIESKSKNCELRDDRFSVRYSSQIEEVYWSGDERAIPNRYRRARNRDEFLSDDDMAEELLERLYRDIASSYF